MTARSKARHKANQAALARRCPLCRQPPGEPCVKVSPLGKGDPYNGVHPERKAKV
jgi:hypothetical protein